MSNHRPSPHQGHGNESHGMVPKGWKRDLINGRIVYITPSNYALWSLDEVVRYLLSEGTCKCGLDCPLLIHQVFNFDPCTCLNHAQSGTLGTCTFPNHAEPGTLGTCTFPNHAEPGTFGTCTFPNHAEPGTFDTLNSSANLCNHKRKLTSIQKYQNELYQKNQAAELEQMYHQRNQSMRREGIVSTTEMIQDGNLPPGHPVDPTATKCSLQLDCTNSTSCDNDTHVQSSSRTTDDPQSSSWSTHVIWNHWSPPPSST